MDILEQQFRAPEIYGDYWLNGDPLQLSSLQGYTVLVDFWDYTSQAWIAGVPYLNEWYRRYRDKGLAIVGVHTPRFPFGRDPEMVREAVGKFDLRYPVVMDNDYLVWGAYRNLVWPTRYLIDKHGYIRYMHGGEGSYQAFEQALQSLLIEIGYLEDLPPLMDPVREADRSGAVRYRSTPEILAGWQRGTIGNVEGSEPESTLHYVDPGVYIEGRMYLQGDWSSHRSNIRLNGAGGDSGSLTLLYRAREVSVVLNPEGEKNFQVFVEQDGKYLDKSNSGSDVYSDDEGRSFLRVTDARLYQVVRNTEFGEHVLRLTSRSNGMSVYCVSFVSTAIPEMTS